MKKFLSIVLTVALLSFTFVGTSCFAKKSFCNDTVTETYDAVQDVYGDQKEKKYKTSAKKTKYQNTKSL